ncbi:MAG: hypothetical protein ACLFP8_01250 [Alphaproteobacteria bacterium]
MAHSVQRNRKPVYIMLLLAVTATSGYALLTSDKTAQATVGGETITKARLDQFYKESISAQLTGAKEATAFMQEHLHDDFETIMHVKSQMGRAPAQEDKIAMTKEQFLQNTEQAYKVGEIKDIDTEILSYEITEGGREVTVQDVTHTMVHVPVNVEGYKPEIFSLRQKIECDNLYVLNDTNTLQLKSGTCDVDGMMEKIERP